MQLFIRHIYNGHGIGTVNLVTLSGTFSIMILTYEPYDMKLAYRDWPKEKTGCNC